MTDLATNPITEPEIDSDLLAEAQRQISAPSLNATINEALRGLVEDERAKRRAALEHLQRMHDEGAFDYSRLSAADGGPGCAGIATASDQRRTGLTISLAGGRRSG